MRGIKVIQLTADNIPELFQLIGQAVGEIPEDKVDIEYSITATIDGVTHEVNQSEIEIAEEELAESDQILTVDQLIVYILDKRNAPTAPVEGDDDVVSDDLP